MPKLQEELKALNAALKDFLSEDNSPEDIYAAYAATLDTLTDIKNKNNKSNEYTTSMVP